MKNLVREVEDTNNSHTFELTRQQIAEPALDERHNAAQEEEPHTPAGRPEAHARTFAHRTRVEAVVDHVLDVETQAKK